MVRTPLYVPALAAALPQAIADAAQGRFDAACRSGGGAERAGPHVVQRHAFLGGVQPRICRACRWRPSPTAAQFGHAFARVYQQACADWPRGAVDPAFYTTPRRRLPTWLLSGGDDPATPPRHGERVARALGPKARHTWCRTPATA